MTTHEELALLHFTAIATGDVQAARACIHPEHVNHMAADEPPACALPGIAGFMATSAWLRSAFSDMTFDPIEIVSEADRTIAHVTFSAGQTGPFTVFPPHGRPVAFPPTGRAFAVRQAHVFRLRDGLHAEHLAVRDDLGMLRQLGHLPPSPAAIARMTRWNLSGNAGRALTHAIDVAHSAADAAQAEAATHIGG